MTKKFHITIVYDKPKKKAHTPRYGVLITRLISLILKVNRFCYVQTQSLGADMGISCGYI